MRLLDLLHPHLDGVTEVVDATGGGIPLGPYLHLPEGVRLRPPRPVTVNRSAGDGWPCSATAPTPPGTATRTRAWRRCGACGPAARA